MEQFPLLDIIIGLTAIFTFLSLLASEVTHTVLKMLRSHDRCFTQGVLTLLGEASSLKNGSKKFNETISYRLLRSLCNHSSLCSFTWNDRSIYPVEVPPIAFAEALLDILQGLSQSCKDGLKHKATTINTMSDLSEVIQSSRELNSQLKANLRRLIQRVQLMDIDADQQLLQLKQELSHWFSHAMIDVSATHQYRFKVVSFIVSTVLVFSVNIDSLYIIRRISENTAIRAIAIKNTTNIKACQKHLNSPECTERMAVLMDSTTIPIGWFPSNLHKQFDQSNGVILARTIGGWFFSSIAISKGSRFWLRVLNQFRVSLRRRKRSSK